MFISILYMFRATMCPSSGEITLSMRHLVHKCQVSHWYSYFSWWWAHSRPKHVQNRNKHTKKNYATSWFYLQDYTRNHGQQNIKFWKYINPLNTELNPIYYFLALLGAHHFLYVSRIRVKLLTLRRLMSYIYGAPILDVSRSHTATQHSR